MRNEPSEGFFKGKEKRNEILKFILIFSVETLTIFSGFLNFSHLGRQH